jgi:hypothetical protein
MAVLFNDRALGNYPAMVTPIEAGAGTVDSLRVAVIGLVS